MTIMIAVIVVSHRHLEATRKGRTKDVCDHLLLLPLADLNRVRVVVLLVAVPELLLLLNAMIAAAFTVPLAMVVRIRVPPNLRALLPLTDDRILGVLVM